MVSDDERRRAAARRAGPAPVGCGGHGGRRGRGARRARRRPPRARAGHDRGPLRPARAAADRRCRRLVQDVGLVALDRAACGLGSSREDLALVDEEAGRAYDAEHGFDPRSVTDLLGGIAGRGRQLEETVEDLLPRLGR